MDKERLTGKPMKTVWRKKEFEPQRTQRTQSKNEISALSLSTEVPQHGTQADAFLAVKSVWT
jgi:hypothetical protein